MVGSKRPLLLKDLITTDEIRTCFPQGAVHVFRYSRHWYTCSGIVDTWGRYTCSGIVDTGGLLPLSFN